MAKNKKILAEFKTVSALADFFDAHDMGDYVSQMPDVHFDIDLKKKTHVVRIDDDLVGHLARVSRLKRIPSQKLVNVWLREKLTAKTAMRGTHKRKALNARSR